MAHRALHALLNVIVGRAGSWTVITSLAYGIVGVSEGCFFPAAPSLRVEFGPGQHNRNIIL